MVFLDNFWDDVVAGPQPERPLGRLRKAVTAKPLTINEAEVDGIKSLSAPTTPSSPATPSSARTDNVWRSVFHPGSNINSRGVGAQVFDKPLPNTPTVYDWMYKGESRSKFR